MAQEAKSKKVRGKLFSLDDSKERTLSRDELVTRVLMGLGFTTNSKGFPYLKKEIIILMDNKSMRISKLHEKLATEENKDVFKKQIEGKDVERWIKTAINNAWKKNKDGIRKLTGQEKKPTMERVISTIAEKVNNRP